jgi:hypothetical protein
MTLQFEFKNLYGINADGLLSAVNIDADISLELPNGSTAKGHLKIKGKLGAPDRPSKYVATVELK